MGMHELAQVTISGCYTTIYVFTKCSGIAQVCTGLPSDRSKLLNGCRSVFRLADLQCWLCYSGPTATAPSGSAGAG